MAIILEQIGVKINHRALRKIVRFEYEDNPEATLEEISNKTGLSIRDIQGIRMDLMKQGERLGNSYALNSQIF